MPPNGPLRHLASRLSLNFIEKGHIQKSSSLQRASPSEYTRFGFHPDDTTQIPRPSRYYGHRQSSTLTEHFRETRIERGIPRASPALAPGRIAVDQQNDRLRDGVEPKSPGLRI